jgi:hypothetical protein
VVEVVHRVDHHAGADRDHQDVARDFDVAVAARCRPDAHLEIPRHGPDRDVARQALAAAPVPLVARRLAAVVPLRQPRRAASMAVVFAPVVLARLFALALVKAHLSLHRLKRRASGAALDSGLRRRRAVLDPVGRRRRAVRGNDHAGAERGDGDGTHGDANELLH